MDLDRGLCCVDIISYISTLVSSDAMVSEHGVNIAHIDFGLVNLLSICADSSAVASRALVHVHG